MAHVFVSYSRKNSDLMIKITSELRAKGVNIWVDRTGLRPGDSDWQENIQNAIERSACMVVLLSPEAKLSKWIKKEFQYAELLGRRIYPLLISGNESNAIPIGLVGVQFIDFRENYDQKIDELVSDLAQYPDTIAEMDFLSAVFVSAN